MADAVTSQKEVSLTYEKLYELLRREKSREELQQLDPIFFTHAVSYLTEKDRTYHDALTKTDVFSMNERQRLQTELHNIHRLVKELYERREKKIIDMALNRSRTSANIIDTTNLLSEERALFDQLVATMDLFRSGVLQNLLQLRAPQLSHLSFTTSFKPQMTETPLQSFTAPNVPPSTTVQFPTTTSATPAHPPISAAILPMSAPSTAPNKFAPDSPGKVSTVSVTPQSSPIPSAGATTNAVPFGMKNVRFLQSVPQVVDSDMLPHGPFDPNDVAHIPKEIADIWIEQGACVEQS
ncbi:hypothetical protein HY492_00770 [Candidatus Woesearchaeota archaeon]|nr:hypothetical protein [Candidatus Woesearchaeota archaeon]